MRPRSRALREDGPQLGGRLPPAWRRWTRAIELREALINAPVLVLGEPPISAIPLLLAYKIMPSIFTAEFAIQYAEAADSVGLRAPFHLEINTGMNRVGVRWDEVVPFMHQIGFHRALELVGTFTHFATAECSETLDLQIQAKRFVEAVGALRAANVNPASCTLPIRRRLSAIPRFTSTW